MYVCICMHVCICHNAVQLGSPTYSIYLALLRSFFIEYLRKPQSLHCGRVPSHRLTAEFCQGPDQFLKGHDTDTGCCRQLPVVQRKPPQHMTWNSWPFVRYKVSFYILLPASCLASACPHDCGIAVCSKSLPSQIQCPSGRAENPASLVATSWSTILRAYRVSALQPQALSE